MAIADYESFIAGKSQIESVDGFVPDSLPGFLFDFQSYLVRWALSKSRAAIFADCGMGKTPMQLAWSDAVVRHTNGRVLILTPLAVAQQTCREADKFGFDARRSVAGELESKIVVTNYERLHKFDPADFVGVVCDESSILKSFDGTTKSQITDFMRKHRYRLLCTATAAPNDFVELGTSSEALGHMGFMDMLTRFFKNNRNNAATQRAWATAGGGAPIWTFKGHAEKPFWQWVATWARALRLPSDLGFDDRSFVLPKLIERVNVVASPPRVGMLFSMPAVGLQEERAERRATLQARCELAASLVDGTGQPAVCWAHLNDEGDTLEKLIPDSLQVSGKDSDDEKEDKLNAFSSGSCRVLVTKPIIGAWGLNWQHCAHMTTFSSHSFEQSYQSIRRMLRFGQTRDVVVDHVLSSAESHVISNLRRKADQAEQLHRSLIENMRNEMLQPKRRAAESNQEVPKWL